MYKNRDVLEHQELTGGHSQFLFWHIWFELSCYHNVTNGGALMDW